LNRSAAIGIRSMSLWLGIALLRDCRLTRRSFSVIDFISKIAAWLQGPSTSGWQPYGG
jgi:hypothetical protein